MRRYLPFAIVAAVALATISSATLLYRAKRNPALVMSKNGSAAETRAAGDIHASGNPNAPITLEEFGDFQCPPCARLSEPINQFEKDYRPNLRVVFHNFPLAVHAHAREAALVAEAAGLQGHFWEMHDLLYREQAIWSKAIEVRTLFNSYAGMLNLDVERFKRDMEGEQASERVAADQKQGVSLGVQNTPTIFLNNRAVDPKALNPDALRTEVEDAVKAKRPSS
jgi:protein-disulfide isomerase